MNALLIFNAQAAAGRAASLLPEVQQALEAFCELRVHVPSEPEEVTRFLANFNLRGIDTVIAAGGDGTLFEAVNGLFLNKSAERPKLGVLPIGTGNAFARDLDLMPGQWEKAVEFIRGGRTRCVDVGKVNTRDDEFYFLNIVGAGLPVDALKTATRLKFLGNAAYTLGTLWQTINLKKFLLNIETKDKKINEESIFFEVSNTRYTGTTFQIAPLAKMDDGRLDVTFVRGLGRLRLLRLFPTIYSGGHIHYPEVSTWQADQVVIHEPAGLPLAVDGELRGCTPATVQCLARNLEVFTG